MMFHVPTLFADDDQFVDGEDAVMMGRCVHATELHTLQLLNLVDL